MTAAVARAAALVHGVARGAAAHAAAVVAAGALGAGVLGAAAAFPDGPPPGHTGGFGEPTCHACHFDQPLNRGPNAADAHLVLDGLPARYRPYARYHVTIELRDPVLRRGGFQLSARFAKGDAAGRDAGELHSVDDRTTVVVAGHDPAISYAQQTGAGSEVDVPGTTRWEIVWRAPVEARGTVIFHVAANAGDDDDSPFGDRVYARSVRVAAPLQ